MKDLYLEFTKSIYSPSRALLCNKRGNNMAHHFLHLLTSILKEKLYFKRNWWFKGISHC